MRPSASGSRPKEHSISLVAQEGEEVDGSGSRVRDVTETARFRGPLRGGSRLCECSLKAILSVVDSVDWIPADIQGNDLCRMGLRRIAAQAEVKHNAVRVGGCITQVDTGQVQASGETALAFIFVFAIVSSHAVFGDGNDPERAVIRSNARVIRVDLRS